MSNDDKKRIQEIEEATGEKYEELKKQTHNVTTEPYQEINQVIDISPFVTNKDGDIYAITNLPEEFIATLFAWVSRSPKSFKEHLQEAIQEFGIQGGNESGYDALSEKAKSFHEKWTVGYGHSSVAEHATAHVGIEKVSRLASAELELSNPFLSITEYSQRYQKPKRGQWHNPLKFFKPSHEFSSGLRTNDLKPNPMHLKYEEFMNKCFDTFEELIDGVYNHLQLKEKEEGFLQPQSGMWQEKHNNQLLKLAFEDARYVLPLAMYTQLGMTANGRAWRDALATLGNSDHEESRRVAQDIKTEVSKVLPVLLKYATPSSYQQNSKKQINELFPSNYNMPTDITKGLVGVESEDRVIDKIIALIDQKTSNMSYYEAQDLAFHTKKERKQEIIMKLLDGMEHFDMAPEVFKHIHYQAYITVSEANWHQLLRHNRKTDFTYSKPSPYFGLTIPPRIKEAGLEHLVKDIAQASKELYNELVETGFQNEAQYVILNAHHRQVFMTFNLWEAYHLINLRTSEEAQWDIRSTFQELYSQLKGVHPMLFSKAKRRLH